MKVKLKRLLAGLIDWLIIISIIVAFEVVDIKNDMLDIISMSLELIFMFYLVPRKDCLFGYVSIGKKIMKLGIYKDDKRVTDKDILRKRTYFTILAFPVNLIYVLKDNKTISDEECNTEVKEIKLNEEIIVKDYSKNKNTTLGFIIDIILIMIFLVLSVLISYYIKWTTLGYKLVLSICIAIIWSILVNSMQGKKTLGQRIANKIKSKKNIKKEILKKIKVLRTLFKKAPIPMISVSLHIIVIVIILFLKERLLFKIVISLLLSMPIICFIDYAYTISKYKKGRLLANIIFPIIVFIPYCFYIFVSIFVIGFTTSMSPDTELWQYTQCSEFFPEKIPKNYEEAKFFHSYAFLQSGSESILYLKIDDDFINDYKEEYKDKTVRFHKDASDPYENIYQDLFEITEYFDLYLLKSNCDDSGYCNHGSEEYILINETTNEIVFYSYYW